MTATGSRTYSKETTDVLKDVHTLNLDSARGCSEVAEHLKDPELSQFFRDCAVQRRGFAADVHRLINLGCGEGVDTDDGATSAAIHRWWINLRALLQDNSEHALLSEAERGEDSILHAYQDALKKDLEPDVQRTLEQQYSWVKTTHDRVKAMRDARA